MTNWSPPGTADDCSLVDLDTYVEELEVAGYFTDSDKADAGENDADDDAEDADETEGDAE